MIVVYVIIGIILVFFLSLLVPLDIVFDYKTEDAASSSIKLRWLFGLVSFNLTRKRGKTTGQISRTHGFLRIRHITFDFRIFSSIIKLVRRLRRTFKIKRLSANIKLGFENPAETAMAFALLKPVSAIFSLFPSTSFEVEPVFSSPAMDVELEGKARVLPFPAAITMFRFIVSRDGRYLMKYLIRKRRH